MACRPIKLPICQETFTNEFKHDFKEGFLKGVIEAINKETEEVEPFFSGLCYNSLAPFSVFQPLRCGGCQLVSYCSRACQKVHWSRHKYVCKEFPVVKGKNVLYSKGSWKKHIAHLRERAS